MCRAATTPPAIRAATNRTIRSPAPPPRCFHSWDRLTVPVTVTSTWERPVGGTRSTDTRFLVVLGLVVVLVRATFVPLPLRNDEGGYLFIARHWHTGGEFLYGDYFVDRPPLLILLFRFASLTTWDHAIRVIAIPFVL